MTFGRRLWTDLKPHALSFSGMLLISAAIAQAANQNLGWLMVQGGLVWWLSRRLHCVPNPQTSKAAQRSIDSATPLDETLQALVKACPLAITVFTLDGTVQLWNPAAEQIFGWRADEVIGKFLPSIPIEKRDEFLSHLATVRQGDSLENLRSRRLRKSGDLIDVEIWAAPIVNAVGTVSCMSIVSDISERSRIEAERRQLIEREQQAQIDREQVRGQLFKTLESITDGFVAYDRAWCITYINTKGAQTLGHCTPDELLGRSAWEAFPGLKASPFGFVLEQALAENRVLEVESFYEPFDAWFSVRVYPSEAGVAVYFRNVTHRRQTAEHLKLALQQEQSARQEAEAANRLKDEFLATLSHELRTPLNVVLGCIQLLQARRSNSTTANRAIDAIDRNTKQLTQLIEDLLDVSQIITGKLKLNPRPVNLSCPIAAAIALVQPAALTKNLQLTWQLDPLEHQAIADIASIQKLMWHLLSNAIKFTPAGGKIEVRLEAAEDAVPAAFARITVSDTGEGIAPEFLPHVFDRFRQADGSLTRAYGGLGLGMAIVRYIVEQHGGTIQAHSAGLGKGTTFTVLLPLATSAGESLNGDRNGRKAVSSPLDPDFVQPDRQRTKTASIQSSNQN
ncbi:PAS domain S-box protein [Microcoleus sp. FACHB-1515]|uniref:sensor histidine kinase n=1 Tax=Cyanophyceae TaxID=3028117 RepID=UPI0016858268|nr:ATP-binding protein [Microcoleus sp. FACHB-1515]MBD2090516.1 PAS domain S-box protein [Microcoleus sp. FACHB-1515]